MDLSLFQTENQNSELTFKTRPNTKSIEDLQRVLSLNKPEPVVKAFANLVALEQVWRWWDDYIINCHDIALVQNDNIDNATKIANIEGNVDDLSEAKVKGEIKVKSELQVKSKAIPDEISPCPALKTPEQVLANTLGYKTWLKAQGVKINDLSLSVDETNQNGIAAVLKGIELAKKHSQNIFPINFNAQTPKGNQTISFKNQDEFELFALQFMKERQSFFN
ncbi:hypothetical protein [Pseudoalteromonas denitrificans]|uniref:Uncharacterized protein n=1 Tax=Pseudoalteromonas denitrificans DSM 6059 TaxID=1123010 RepID=A0A1I1Q7U7_9GAMM|nr:hypothetical protein [Pseudoalteromonas denitrificans]SFD14180.1 hypothetical protein SAMN02745724_03632 [Pseudoalteromonas denitrificans DSM 6059]